MTPIRFFVLALALVACAEKRPTTPLVPHHLRMAGAGKTAKLTGPPGLPAKVIAELGADADVRFVRNGALGMLVARRNGRWLAGPVTAGTRGSAVKAKDAAAGLRDVAAAPVDATPTALGAFGDGFALAWVQPVQAGDELWALAIGPNGQARGVARKLTRTFEPIHWVELLEGGARVTAVWEVKRHDKNDLLAAAWSREGVSEPQVVAKGIGGWHGAANREGALLAWVTENEREGHAFARTIDARGALGPELKLTEAATALADVQVAALEKSYAVAWTDNRASDPNVQLAIVGDKRVSRSGPALAPLGGQALVSLVPSSNKKRALLAWEREGNVSGGRSIRLGVVDASGKLGDARAVLEIAASDAPHLVSDGEGFAALTLAPMRVEGAADAPVVPFYVRFDSALAVRAAEPVRVDALAKKGGVVAGVPRSVRSLECDGGLCTVVARGDGAPALMMLVSLPVRATPWQKPARRLPVAQPPLAMALEAVGDLEQPVADMAAARLADGRVLVAWVTHALDQQATLSFRFIDAEGREGPVQTLSKKAASVGGVEVLALPADSKTRGVALLAWAGSDAQVLLTSLSASGKTERQKSVTRVKKGEVFDVTVASDNAGGFLCAWTDTRDGDHEIYAARVDAELEKRKGDRRVTHKPGPSTEASLRVVGERALLIWSDSENAGDARADIYIAGIDRGSLETVLPARRLQATEAHSRTPRWSAGAPTASWIEEPLEDGKAETGGELRLVAVSDSAEPLTAARRVRLPSGAPVTSAGLGCDASRCRGVLAAASGNALELGAFSAPRESGAPVRAQSLTTLAGGTAQDLLLTAPDQALEQVFFAQDARRGAAAGPSAARLRRLRIKW